MKPYICAIDSSVFINLVQILDCKNVLEVQEKLANRSFGRRTSISHESALYLLHFKNKVLSREIIPYLPTKVYDEIVNTKYRTKEEDNFREQYCKDLVFKYPNNIVKETYFRKQIAKVQAYLVNKYLANGIFSNEKDLNDAIIMAQACSFGLPLVTTNIKHSIDTNCDEVSGNIKKVVKRVNQEFAQTELGIKLLEEGVVNPYITYVEPVSCMWAIFDCFNIEEHAKKEQIESSKYLICYLGEEIELWSETTTPIYD